MDRGVKSDARKKYLRKFVSFFRNEIFTEEDLLQNGSVVIAEFETHLFLQCSFLFVINKHFALQMVLQKFHANMTHFLVHPVFNFF